MSAGAGRKLFGVYFLARVSVSLSSRARVLLSGGCAICSPEFASQENIRHKNLHSDDTKEKVETIHNFTNFVVLCSLNGLMLC